MQQHNRKYYDKQFGNEFIDINQDDLDENQNFNEQFPVYQSIQEAFDMLSSYYESDYSYRSMEKLDTSKFSEFFQKFGYDLEQTSVFKFPKGGLVLITALNSTKIYEFIKGFPTTPWEDRLNTSFRIPIDAIFIENSSRNVIPIVKPGINLQYNQQNGNPPNTTRLFNIESTATYPLGAMANKDSFKYASILLFHELYHLRFDNNVNKIKSEINASRYAISVLEYLKDNGFNIQNEKDEDIYNYLRSSLKTYLKLLPLRQRIKIQLKSLMQIRKTPHSQ